MNDCFYILRYLNCTNKFPRMIHCRGKMKVDVLEREIQRALSDGGVPLMVNATCGTTVLAAYDPVDKIADICQKNGIWLHVDVSKI